jgi:FkbM family methyltransferase
LLKTFASWLPASVQHSLKRRRFARQIRVGAFIPRSEPEILIIETTVREGDWVIDVGANIGHYTCQLSQCVGSTGRVIAIEPVPDTFDLLSSNVHVHARNNVTLINAAASDRTGVSAMQLPKFASGLTNYYRAALADNGDHHVLCLPIDALGLPKVALLKIDAEGHDLAVLKGANALIERDQPVLIVECALDDEVADWMRARGYVLTRAPGSPNVVARPGR